MKKHTGFFCWNDLRTADYQFAFKFYQGLFHWDFRDSETADLRPYKVLKVDGKELGGIYSFQPETVARGVHSHWLPYVAVENAHEAVKKARDLGAQIVKEPFEFKDHGTIAVLRDPTGALLGVWQAKAFPGSEITGKPGTAVWNELVTRDLESAIRFYGALFGWNANREQFAKMRYIVLERDGQPVGGLSEPGPEWGDTPLQWMTYFRVEDCPASTGMAKKLGADALAEPMEIPDVGIVSVIRDPQDAVFGLLQPKMAGQKAA